MRDERSSYLEYQKVQREVERFTRLLIAYQFLVASRTADSASGEIEEMKAIKVRLQEQVIALSDCCTVLSAFRTKSLPCLCLSAACKEYVLSKVYFYTKMHPGVQSPAVLILILPALN